MFDSAHACRESHVRSSVAARYGKKAPGCIVNRQTKRGGRKRRPGGQIQEQISRARRLAMAGTEYGRNISSGTETLISHLQRHLPEKTSAPP
jgi:hypothetical protein